ncbi:M14 family zinc carboxypeptidase [Natronococcus sp. A-GB7]|uniref:M14 family zinc carboxypeptidase n=1 Tax=Natronococcus sp. A-GB7 TaxID=3037649 RepID=UPI00241BFC77|nr:M14 family zinc carboxypeptidase [Natronococcus sp. A-GB7]MDG5820293.1 M14 family zinc carboxypeptidase [Natronococcus sp. A-GB7]
MSSDHHHSGSVESESDRERYTYEEAAELGESAFEGGAVDRRTFLSVAAATGAALALPNAVAAEVEHPALTDRAAFVVNATPDDYEVPVVIEFDAAAGVPEDFEAEYTDPDWDVDDQTAPPTAVTRSEPTPAAHARLDADELGSVLDEFDDYVEAVAYSMGANPWWHLEDPYADGVFPPVEESRDWLSFEESVQGIRYLEAEVAPDRIDFYSIGESPGWNNQFTGEDPDPNDVYVTEVTNDVDDEASFAEKEKVVYSLNIHGDERAGTEAGCRIIEDIAYGEAPEFEELLDDVVLLFLFTNPDGWVSRKPETEIPWVADHNWNFQRGSGSGLDTNRQYPTMGWTDPSFWPAEPVDTPDVRPDDPDGRGYHEMVPDSLAIVEHFRDYDNVEFLCDYHGMYTADHMVFNLETNAPFTHDKTHDLDEVSIQIGEAMADEWGSVDAEPLASDIMAAGETEYGAPFLPEGDSYDGLLDWGTIYDSLAYQVTGAFLGWAGQPEEFGGLGAVTVAPEVIISNHFGSAIKQWKPYWTRHYETAYRLSMREYARMTAAETDATVATDGQDTAYVSSDELTRRSADLPHTDESPGQGQGPGQDRATEVRRRHETVQPGPDGRSSVNTSSGESTHSLFVHFQGLSNATQGTVRLVNPGGNVVKEIDLADRDVRRHDFEDWFVRRPETGDWNVEIDTDADVDVQTTLIESEGAPDPRDTLGYEQTEYVVNPMQFFEDLGPFVEDGDVNGLRVHDVRNGRLLRGQSGQRHYDKLVVSHDDGADDDRYISAIEAFVEAGGDLVLTDSGVNLLGALDVGDAADIDGDDVSDIEVNFANLEDREFDHDLLAGIRPRQQEIWKGSQLGYTTGVDQPATVVDEDAFREASGEVAGTIGGEGVGAGRLAAGDAEITVIGSVLPPAQQTELHPFGMADYAVSFMGHTLLCNALGFQQRRYVDGELVGTYGEVR